MKLKFPRQFFFRKYLNVKLNENSLIEAELLWTEGQIYEANRLFRSFANSFKRTVEWMSNFLVI